MKSLFTSVIIALSSCTFAMAENAADVFNDASKVIFQPEHLISQMNQKDGSETIVVYGNKEINYLQLELTGKTKPLSESRKLVIGDRFDIDDLLEVEVNRNNVLEWHVATSNQPSSLKSNESVKVNVLGVGKAFKENGFLLFEWL